KLDDVAWDLLLELLRAERLRQRLSVSGLTISISGVSATTSLRRMNELAAREYIERIPDPADARRDFVALTPKSQALLADYLALAIAYVSAVSALPPAFWRRQKHSRCTYLRPPDCPGRLSCMSSGSEKNGGRKLIARQR